jgi:DnaJ-domain-containing protein 1
MPRPRATWIQLPGAMRHAFRLEDGLSVKRLREAAAKPHLRFYRRLRVALRNHIYELQEKLEAAERKRIAPKFGGPKVLRRALQQRREMLDELRSPTALLHIADEVERIAAQEAADRAEDERYWRANWQRRMERKLARDADQLRRQGIDPEQFRELLGLPPLSTSRALTVLGLPADATAAQIKQRYRNLALQHHPDRGGDEARMSEINAAYRVLRAR